MVRSELVIPKVWRSEIEGIALFLLFSIVSIVLSRQFEATIFTGPLFTIGSSTYYLSFPLLSIIPLFFLATSIFRIYNVRYSVDKGGVRARLGVISVKEIDYSVRYEDIRAINIGRTIIEKMLDIGKVEISSAASSDVELTLEGVAYPDDIKRMLERERDKRQKNMTRNYNKETAEEMRKAGVI